MEERDRIKAAVAQWWSGGGTTRKIVDVLEREGASDRECRFVAAKLAAAANRLHVITETIIEEELELARAAGSAGTVPVDRGFDGARCIYNEKPCPECAEWDKSDGVPIIHGHLLTMLELQDRIEELRALLTARHEEMGPDGLKVWI